jgi:HK97 family phage prohead protease
MAIRDNREYRNLGTFETKSEEGSEFIVRGYASTFEPYLIYEEDGVQYVERIAPTAFDDADMSDVVFLRDHTGRVLARTKNGALNLSTDTHGLFSETNLGLTQASKEMYEDIRTGNYSQMSFSFVVAKGGQHFEEEARKVTRVIDRISKVYDVSAVSFPQNPGTDIGVSYRDLFNGVIERREAERLKAIRARKLLELKMKLFER